MDGLHISIAVDFSSSKSGSCLVTYSPLFILAGSRDQFDIPAESVIHQSLLS